jgi:transposase
VPGGRARISPSPDRKGEHSQTHLQDFKGVIQADRFAGYDKLHDDTGVEAACWAQVRRKFHAISHHSPVICCMTTKKR